MAIEARGVTRRDRFESGCVRFERIIPTAGGRNRIRGTAGMTNRAVVVGLRLVILGPSLPRHHTGPGNPKCSAGDVIAQRERRRQKLNLPPGFNPRPNPGNHVLVLIVRKLN